MAEPADIWTLAALTDTIAILRSLSEVCGLDAVDDVLNATEGFNLLSAGQLAFTGRNGEKLWNEIGAVVAERWDEVVDALDAIVTTPEVDTEALEMGQAEAAAISAAEKQPEDAAGSRRELDEDRDEDLEFWDENGRRLPGGHHRRPHRLHPALLPGRDAGLPVQGRPDPDLHAAGGPGELPHRDRPRPRLATLAVWPDIRKAVADGEAAVLAGPENTYLMDDLDRSLLEGPDAVDRKQLELAVELLVDAAIQRDDQETIDALGSASPLGNLVGATIKPDPERQAPAPPFDDEVAAWTVLVERFAGTLDWDGERG